jgi:hypothetical protein
MLQFLATAAPARYNPTTCGSNPLFLKRLSGKSIDLCPAGIVPAPRGCLLSHASCLFI